MNKRENLFTILLNFVIRKFDKYSVCGIPTQHIPATTFSELHTVNIVLTSPKISTDYPLKTVPTPLYKNSTDSQTKIVPTRLKIVPALTPLLTDSPTIL